jgi:hypothetical protein
MPPMSAQVAELRDHPPPAVLRRETLRNEYLAFASLALTQRRLSWTARKRAREAEAKAHLDDYRHFASEARRLWRAAVYHLWVAQQRKADLNG